MKFTTASEVDLGHEKVGKLLFMLAVPAILKAQGRLLKSFSILLQRITLKKRLSSAEHSVWETAKTAFA